MGTNALALVGSEIARSVPSYTACRRIGPNPCKVDAVLGLTMPSRVMPKLALLLKSSEVTITTVLLLPTPQDWYAVIVFKLRHCTPDGMEKSAGRVRVTTVPL